MQVRPDGKITLPLLGDLEATGRTPIELRDTITTSLKEYITNPIVTVIVVEATGGDGLRDGRGESSRRGDAAGRPLTVLQALAIAGGLKDFANTKNIRILRRSATGVQTITFNYKERDRAAAPVYLRAGRHRRRPGLRRR